jgi:flagellum-specific peptidoglycan hydrolase FlgJ
MKNNSILIFSLIGLFVVSSCGSKKAAVSHRANKAAVEAKINSVETSKQQNSSATPLTGEQRVRHYIQSYAEVALQEMDLYNIPASITLAQGILESGSGYGTLAVNANNHFGIKCHSTWTGERVYHDDDQLGECFRKYTDVKYSYRDHSLFLSQRTRYADLFELKISDYKAWAHGLKKAGYATDPKYPEKLISLIERYELWQFDRQSTKADKKRQKKSKTKGSLQGKNRRYIVIAGDTLYSLSRRFGTTVDQLMRHNKLKTTDLSVGQELRIPR